MMTSISNTLQKSFSESSTSLNVYSSASESETETTERHDDDEDETERDDDDRPKELTPEDLSKLEKQKVKKLAKHMMKKERRKQFRKERKKAVKRDERLKLLTDTMLGTMFLEKKAQRRSERSLFRVSFREGDAMCVTLLFDEDESPKHINEPSHVAEEHNDIPWDEWEEEPLTNWWDQPDLDEDDEVTKLCKKVLIASATKDVGQGNIEIKADKIHALVIKFALKVYQRVKERGQDWRNLPASDFPPTVPASTIAH